MDFTKDHEAFTLHPRHTEINEVLHRFINYFLTLELGDRDEPLKNFVNSVDLADWPAYRGAICLIFRRESSCESDEAIAVCRVLNSLLKAFTPTADVTKVVEAASARVEFQALPDDSKAVMGGIGMILMGMAALQALAETDVEVASLLSDLDERVAEFLTNAGERFGRVKH